MGDFWDVKLVTPQALVELKSEYEASESESICDFCQRVLENFNHQLDDMEADGKKNAYPSYSIGGRFYCNNDESGMAIGYANSTRSNDPLETLAIAKVQFAAIKERHDYDLRLYEDYDKAMFTMRRLISEIRKYGGHVEYQRPYFRITLPIAEGALRTETVQIPGHDYFIHALNRTLDKIVPGRFHNN